MESIPQTILYFGGQTDAWVDGIDQLYRQAATIPWLQTFLDVDLLQIIKEESKGMDHVLRDSLGDYSSLLELAARYRYTTDEVGMFRAVLLHAVRAAMLLQWVKQEPELVSTAGSKPERLGISGRLTNFCALAISEDFSSLYEAVLEVARLFVRLCRFTSVRSRAVNHYKARSSMPPLQLSETVLTFLWKIADATNAEAAKDKQLVPHLPILGSPSGSILTLYRGHSDMPTELRAKLPSLAAPKLLKKTGDEIGKSLGHVSGLKKRMISWFLPFVLQILASCWKGAR